MEEQARALADGIEATLQDWVERSVEQMLVAHVGWADGGVLAAAREAGTRAAAEIAPRVRALLETDIDRQWTNPLALLRQAVPYPTKVLREAGVPPVERDEFSVERFPDDDYDLSPASFGDIHPSLAELGVAWGASKAWAHKRRHGAARTA